MRICLFLVVVCITESLILNADKEYQFQHIEAAFGTQYENQSETQWKR